MRTYKKNLTGILLLCMFAAVTLSFISCDKEEKKYEGGPQLAFASTTYKKTVTVQANSITIPIQLISSSVVHASGTVIVNPTSTCADAINFTPNFVIDPATFSYNLVIGINYAALSKGKNTLVLNLESSMPIAKYYGTATITLTK
ncbi:MAG: hypothetical protein RR312_08765 [Bacteroidales bacterium]